MSFEFSAPTLRKTVQVPESLKSVINAVATAKNGLTNPCHHLGVMVSQLFFCDARHEDAALKIVTLEAARITDVSDI